MKKLEKWIDNHRTRGAMAEMVDMDSMRQALCLIEELAEKVRKLGVICVDSDIHEAMERAGIDEKA